MHENSKTFMMRFPILYVAFFAISAWLETIRSITQNELDILREKYKFYAAHDYLTGLLNRQGLEEWYASSDRQEEQSAAKRSSTSPSASAWPKVRTN